MKPSRMLAAIACLLSCLSLSAQDMMDEGGIFETPEVTVKDLDLDTKKPVDMTVKIPQDCNAYGCDLVLKRPGSIKFQLELTGEKYKKSFSITSGGQTLKHEETELKKNKGSKEFLEPDESFRNHTLSVNSKDFNIVYFVLPNFWRYTADDVNKNVTKWEETIPNAINRSTRIDIRPVPGGVGLWIDGVYVHRMPGKGKLKTLKITGGRGPAFSNAKAYKATQSTPLYETVNFSYIANPGAMKKAEVSLKPGPAVIEGVPMIVCDGAHSSDMSLPRPLRGMNFKDEGDYYMSRTAWERHPTTQQSAIPNDFYNEVYLLFALDPDPKKDRAMSLRMGRFSAGGRTSGYAYTDIFLPKDDAKFPENIKKVGDVTLNGKTVPLYFGKFQIPCGEILDIITKDLDNMHGYAQFPRGLDYLDFELMGRRYEKSAYNDFSHCPDERRYSAFNIFGITFRKAGVYMEMIQSEPGNIFFNDEKPETKVSVRCDRPGNYSMKWSILDSWGKKVLKTGTEPLKFSKAGDKQVITLDLAQPDLGYYPLKLELLEDGKVSYTHDASFALMGPDTRKAEAEESPFGTWWTPNHCGIRDPNVWMKICFMAGIRRPCGLDRYLKPDGTLQHQDLIDKYKLTLLEFGFIGMPPDQEKEPEEFETFMHAHNDAVHKAFPKTKYQLIFHESTGDEYVKEMEGIKEEATEENKEHAKIALQMGTWLKKHYPDLKIVYGNHISSSKLTAALMRCNFPMELLDFIGLETPAQGCIPERISQGSTQGAFFPKEIGRTWGKDVKVTGCFEYSSRPDRLFDTPQLQAAYFMRDALIGLCHGFETLGISGLTAAGNWYAQTVWGGNGLCARTPFIYPQPLLPAYGALTRALDRIKFNPKVWDTGNPCLYVPEFDRKDGKTAYAFWCPKGEVEVEFTFPKDVEAEYIEFMGKTSKVSGKTLKMTASIYPQYLVVPVKADSVKHLRTISPQPPATYKKAVTFDNLDNIRLIRHAVSLNEDENKTRPGNFEIKEVNDEQMGKCLEIKLIPNNKLPDIFSEYCRIELKKPVPIADTPDEFGFWVKGDGGWGQIVCDVQDARGIRYHNIGDCTDFEGNSFINFKDWYFMTYPFPGRGTKSRSPQSLGGLYHGEGGGSAVYPLKLVSIHILLRRKMLCPGEMKEVPAVIRLKEFGGIANAEYQPNLDY